MSENTVVLTIAIVEDDTILREELEHFLLSHGHVVHAMVGGAALDDLSQETAIDILILDLNLPGLSGLEIAQLYREKYHDLGIIILSARTSAVDRIGSYDCGADIYIPKPCSPGELLAAIGSLARRVRSNLKSDTWRVYPARHLIKSPNGSKVISLLRVETSILTLLARAPKQQLSADDLCLLIASGTAVQQPVEPITRRALENSISRLRRKFNEKDTFDSSFIRSVRGEGYQLCAPVAIVEEGISAGALSKIDIQRQRQD